MGAALVAASSCTDTWNEHYETETGTSADQTLWQTISQDESLSKFAQLMEAAKYYRDENHPAYTTAADGSQEPYTYKQVLEGNNTVTVWAIKNDALSDNGNENDKEDWAYWLKMAQEDGYNFQQQFIGNHMALSRRPMAASGTESERIRLVNNKLAEINYANQTFAGSKIIKSDIGTRNGLLHIIDKLTPFDYNIYEYIKFNTDAKTSKIREYIVKRDTTYFVPGLSIEGLPDENGNPTYVDSVYFQGNMNFSWRLYNPTDYDSNDAWMNGMKMMWAEINAEDSAFVVVIPTNTAWDEAVNRLSPYYNYADTYPRMDKIKTGDKTKTIDIKNARQTYTTSDGSLYQTTDSLRDVNVTMDIATQLAFNLNEQPQINKQKWTMEEFMKNYELCPYLINTRGDTIFNKKLDKQGRGCDLSEVFSGNKVKMSNGYVIETDRWGMPSDVWKRAVGVNCGYNYYEKSSSTQLSTGNINVSQSEKWIDIYGRPSYLDYAIVTGNTTNTRPEIVFPLYGSDQGNAYVMSNLNGQGAKYDIYAVMVPVWYKTSQEEPDFFKVITEEVPDPTEEDPGHTRLDTIEIVHQHNLLEFTLYYWNGIPDKSTYEYKNQASISKKNIIYTGEKVEPVLIFEDVEFPYSYMNLYNTYPVLKIASLAHSNSNCQNNDKSTHSLGFNIDRILLVPKEN